MRSLSSTCLHFGGLPLFFHVHHMSALSIEADIKDVKGNTAFYELLPSPSLPASDMDYQVVFSALETVCEDNISIWCVDSDMPYGAVAKRLVTCMRQIQEHGRALEPIVASFTTVYHHYDFDAQTPGNGYRTLVKVRLVDYTVTGVT